MNLRKHGLKILGLTFFAALGLMSFMASAAQAEAGLFLILLKPALLATASGEMEGLGILLVAALNVEIDCTSLDVVNGHLLNDTEGLAIVLYLGCVYRQLGDLTKGLGADCLIKSGGVAGDIKAVATLKAILVKLPSGVKDQLLILAKGDSTEGVERFALVESTGCSVPEKVEVKGSVVFLTTEHDVVKQLIHQAPDALQLPLSDLLRYGVNHAVIHGGAWVFLTGAHEGCDWGSI